MVNDDYIIWLVVDWNHGMDWMDYDFPYLGNFIIPTDELIFFRGVETTSQMITILLGGSVVFFSDFEII